MAALVATPVMLIATGGVAGATNVSDQDALQSAFENSATTTIDLTQDVVIDSSGDANCDQFYRNSGTSLVIDGHGFSITKASECEGERIFKQSDNGAITFQNVTVSGGVKEGGAGGALKTSGDVHVIDSTFHDNQALENCNYTSTDVTEQGCSSPFGGAIYSTGSVTVSGSTFADNHSDKAGGAILTWNNITVSNGSTFSGNSATCDEECWGSGGGFLAKGGADVSDSSITGNTAGCNAYCEGSGGGFLAGGSTSVTGSDVSGNTAGCDIYCEGDGGGFFASGFTEKAMAEAADANAAAADPGQIVVASSTINGNTAKCDTEAINLEQAKAAQGNIPCGSGGGFFAYEADSVSVDQSTLSGNTATCLPFIWDAASTEYYYYCGSGGGFYSAYSDQVSVNATTLDNNTAAIYGGALSTGCQECNNTNVDLVNSTITANTSGASGAIDVFGYDEVLNLTHDTIVQNILDPIEQMVPVENQANTEEPAANVSANSLNSFGTIVALPIGGVNCEFPEKGDGTVTEQYNFSDDQSCDFIVSTDDVATPNDPSLLALGNYGGPTQTMRPTGLIEDGVLQNLSPVVDQIPAADCVLDVDQRGISRPQTVKADACDIGAVEITAEEITVSNEVVVNPPPVAPPLVIAPKFTG